jgi:predicted SAM-dependent methyltransferase
VQGIEPSEYPTGIAQSQGLDVFCGTIEAYAAQASQRTRFDIITANHVVEHVPYPVETLRAMKRLLAPRGFIWIAVPNAAYPICRALKGRWHSCDLPYHLMQFTPASVAKAGRRVGLNVRIQRTESIPAIVRGSLGQYLRYRWKLPRRLTNKLGILDAAAHWYAKRVDSSLNGEAILTEFVAEST